MIRKCILGECDSLAIDEDNLSLKGLCCKDCEFNYICKEVCDNINIDCEHVI